MTCYHYSPQTVEEQINLDYSSLVKRYLPLLPEDKPALYICHCGFIDKDLLGNSTLTIQRMNDVALACDSEIIRLIEEMGIELITYRDLY